MNIWDTYKNFGTIAKRMFKSFLVLGLATFSAGIYFDLSSPGWWQHLAYVPNVLASLTGFFIGVPFALVALASFTAEREMRSELDRVNAISEAGWARFRNAVERFCSDPRIETLLHTTGKVPQAYNEVVGAVQECLDLNREYVGGEEQQQEEGAELAVANLGQKRDALVDLVQQIEDAVGRDYELEMAWSEVCAAWSNLDTFVKIRRSTVGLGWLNVYADADIRDCLASKDNPVTAFTHVQEKASNVVPITRMKGIISIGSAMGEKAEDLMAGLELILLAFDNGGADEYRDKATEAGNFLTTLLGAIDQVVEENWPASGGQPRKANPEVSA